MALFEVAARRHERRACDIVGLYHRIGAEDNVTVNRRYSYECEQQCTNMWYNEEFEFKGLRSLPATSWVITAQDDHMNVTAECSIVGADGVSLEPPDDDIMTPPKSGWKTANGVAVLNISVDEVEQIDICEARMFHV